MERLSDIPPQQLLVLGLLVILLTTGGFYFLAITPLEEGINGNKIKYSKLSQEYKKLEQFHQPGKLEELKEAEEREKARIEENKTLLPSQAELPGFIRSIKADADSVDLVIHKFEVGETMEEDYYNRIPIDVKAVGSFNQLIAFLKTISSPSKRTVNVKDMFIKHLDMEGEALKAMVSESEDITVAEAVQGRDTRGTTPEQKRYMAILREEERNKHSYVEAKFTIHAFSYTGKMADRSKKRRRRR